MKKKVLHILSSSEYSGAENVAINIIKSLEDEYEFTYASPSGTIIDVLKDKNIKHICLEKNSISYLNKILKGWQPDIIHAHDFRASIKAAMSPYKCKKISHLHQNPAWIKSINIRSVLYAISSIGLDKVATVSPEILEEAIFAKVIFNKATVLLNNVDIESVINSSNQIGHDEKFDVAFVGRLTEVKNPLRFISIIKEVSKENKQIRAVIVGDGDLRDDCSQLIECLDLKKNIKMLGFLPNPFPVMKNSKILAITSDWEGFGLVAVEAMTLGKPVFATPVGGLKTIIGRGGGTLCDTDEEFAEKIVGVLENENQYKQLSDAAIKNAKIFSNQEKWVGEIKKIYNE